MFQAKFVQVSILALWVLNVGLFHPEVELLVQGVNQEGKILLAVLLLKADKLVAALGKHLLEVAWYDRASRVPHPLKQQAEGRDEGALEPQRVPHICLLFLQASHDEVLVDHLQIGYNL